MQRQLAMASSQWLAAMSSRVGSGAGASSSGGGIVGRLAALLDRPALSSSSSSLLDRVTVLMGRGDPRTRRGKVRAARPSPSPPRELLWGRRCRPPERGSTNQQDPRFRAGPPPPPAARGKRRCLQPPSVFASRRLCVLTFDRRIPLTSPLCMDVFQIFKGSHGKVGGDGCGACQQSRGLAWEGAAISLQIRPSCWVGPPHAMLGAGT